MSLQSLCNEADLLPKHCNQSGLRDICMSVSISSFDRVGMRVMRVRSFHQVACCRAVLYSKEPFDQSQGIERVSAARRMATTPLPGAASL